MLIFTIAKKDKIVLVALIQVCMKYPPLERKSKDDAARSRNALTLVAFEIMMSFDAASFEVGVEREKGCSGETLCLHQQSH